MDLGLNGKVVLVTGAGSQIGFGKGICLALAKEGCNIVASDINIIGAEQTAADIRALGREAIAIKADVGKGDEVNQMVKTALEKFTRIDILVNNAGVSSGMLPFLELTEKEWDRDLNIDLKGTMYCIKAVLPQMIERKSGKIINISSGAGVKGHLNVSTYSAAKAGVIGFSRSLACELASSGVNVNVIAPGLADTNFHRAANVPPSFLEFVKTSVADGTVITVEDMGNAVVFLASNAAQHISGQVLNLWIERFK
jgi:NAD(P)-dependent dehydrogenase (short-subunit alcohol dehydrogenase family)